MPRLASLTLAVATLALVSSVAGCVERKLYVRCDPVDANVAIDGQDLGSGTEAKPVELAFEHYGVRRVVARAPGREPAAELVTLDPPWWQVFPIDIVPDVLLPWTIDDERTVEMKLKPRAAPTRADAEAAEKRARDFADEAERRP